MKLFVPYVPSPPEQIETIFRLIKIIPGQKSIDLGSGDGRLVIAMAKRGLEAHGFEIREKYVRRAKLNIIKQGLQGKAFIHQGDFWEENLGLYDIVSIYGMAAIMDELEKKFTRELRPSTLVISNGFKIPHWNTWKEEEHLYIYKKHRTIYE